MTGALGLVLIALGLAIGAYAVSRRGMASDILALAALACMAYGAGLTYVTAQ